MKNPQDSDFRYIGLTEDQIALLSEESAETRELVYGEALRLLMEFDSGHDDLYKELL
jgi:hypothetical protein